MYGYKKANILDKLFRLLNLQEYKLERAQEIIEVLCYSVISFAVPLFFKHPQVLVGAVVNSMLVLAALNLRTKNLLPMIVLPSIAAALGGYLFGGLTSYLLYLIPFIWIGNLILVITFKKLKFENKTNYALTLGTASSLKAGFLFAVTFVLFMAQIVPSSFLIAMGPLQLLTAVLGGSISFSVQKMKSMI